MTLMRSKEAAQRVVEVAAGANAQVAEVQSAIQAFFDDVRHDTAAQAEAALGILSKGIGVNDTECAAQVALVCGALVERGLDPAPMGPAMLQRLRSIVPLARRLHDGCMTRVSLDAHDAEAQLAQALEQARASTSAEAAAWNLLESLFQPAIAMFAASPGLRDQGRSLLADLEAISANHAGAHWIATLLKVLHEEPYVALEPATGRGIAGRMSGIADNFQLNVLLMDVFPRGLLSAPRVSASAAQVARGEGPQQTEEHLTGHWNLYGWTALTEKKTLPDPKDHGSQAHWVWNEGTPADIPSFEGTRVILLGPPSYERSWSSQRLFSRLPAELTVDRKLSRTEVDQWLDRVARAPQT